MFIKLLAAYLVLVVLSWIAWVWLFFDRGFIDAVIEAPSWYFFSFLGAPLALGGVLATASVMEKKWFPAILFALGTIMVCGFFTGLRYESRIPQECYKEIVPAAVTAAYKDKHEGRKPSQELSEPLKLPYLMLGFHERHFTGKPQEVVSRLSAAKIAEMVGTKIRPKLKAGFWGWLSPPPAAVLTAVVLMVPYHESKARYSGGGTWIRRACEVTVLDWPSLRILARKRFIPTEKAPPFKPPGHYLSDKPCLKSIIEWLTR